MNYERATKLYDEVEEVRVATLLTIIGSLANDVYEGIKFEKGKEKKMDEIIKAFDNYFMGKSHRCHHVYLCYLMKLKPFVIKTTSFLYNHIGSSVPRM